MPQAFVDTHADDLAALGVDAAVCRRVLLVDDQAENLEVLRAILEDDWEVATAATAHDALRWIDANGAPDLVISDQRMPGMTGVEFLTDVATLHPDTARMILTGYGDVEPMVDAVNRGAVSRFLFKPWTAEEIRSAVSEALALKAARTTLRRLVDALQSRRAALRTTIDDTVRAQSQVAASERLSTMGRLTAGVAHDVRNQLGVLVFLVCELRDASADASTIAAGDNALSSLKALLALVTDVNAFAQSRPVALDFDTFDLHAALKSTVALLRLDEDVGDLEIQIEVAPAAQFPVGDAARLRLAVAALLRNAALAHPTSAVRLVASRAGDDYRIDVSDDGCGMSAETLRRAGEPFFSAFPGGRVGIGLWVAEMTAAAHGGRVELVSEVGRGTRATLAWSARR